MKDIPLSELICTRISHDLIGNIGAVANAVELMEDDDVDFFDDIKEILKVSSQLLSARAKFFRMAFGLDNANLSDLDLVEKTIRGYLQTVGNKNFPLEFFWKNCSIKFSKIIMLSVMILADVSIKGGKICAFEENCKLFVNISDISKASAPKINDILALLSGEEEEYLAQYAPVFYLKNLLEKSDLHLSISEEGVFGFEIG